jgi:hypothetical protein
LIRRLARRDARNGDGLPGLLNPFPQVCQPRATVSTIQR